MSLHSSLRVRCKTTAYGSRACCNVVRDAWGQYPPTHGYSGVARGPRGRTVSLHSNLRVRCKTTAYRSRACCNVVRDAWDSTPPMGTPGVARGPQR